MSSSNLSVVTFATSFFTGLLLLASALIAHAQANGTVIILEMTPRGLFVAADSRSIVGSKPPEDNHCKLVALTDNSIFAVAGAAAYSSGKGNRAPSWDAIQEAKRAALKGRMSSTSAQTVEVTADSWATKMLANWNAIKMWHPDSIKEAEKIGKGVLTTGIFAAGKSGTISLAFRQIKSTNGTISSDAPRVSEYCAMGRPCGAGDADILDELSGLTGSERAAKEQLPACSAVFTNCDPASLEVIRLVDLTIARHPHGGVGGPVDALQLGLDGRITWLQRKKNCAEGY
jgi:hypothetical protein